MAVIIFLCTQTLHTRCKQAQNSFKIRITNCGQHDITS